MAVTPGLRHKNEHGLTVIELIVALAVLSITIGTAIPSTQHGLYALWGANEQLLADLRRTRADALTKGSHFRLDVTGASSYEVLRLALVDGAWVPTGSPLRTRTLPAGLTFTEGSDASFEFNTRGLLVPQDPDEPLTTVSVRLRDADTGHSRRITIWPSGQVAPL